MRQGGGQTVGAARRREPPIPSQTRGHFRCFEAVSHAHRICDRFQDRDVLLPLVMDPSTKPKLTRGDSAFPARFTICSLIAGPTRTRRESSLARRPTPGFEGF